MRTHLKNARLIDGTGAGPVDSASVIIERDTIVHAGPLARGNEPTGETRVIDVAGKSVIPGLIEAHLHLSYNNVKAIADLDLNCRRSTRPSSPRRTRSSC
jgi:predicted amidohydrolase YtcJ